MRFPLLLVKLALSIAFVFPSSLLAQDPAKVIDAFPIFTNHREQTEF